jgi:hypothetical protein
LLTFAGNGCFEYEMILANGNPAINAIVAECLFDATRHSPGKAVLILQAKAGFRLDHFAVVDYLHPANDRAAL